jgi:hypothetical protein
VLVVGKHGVEVGDAGVQRGVPWDKGCLGGAGFAVVAVVVFVVVVVVGSFEIPLGECAAPADWGHLSTG